jgi:hypothetical protein
MVRMRRRPLMRTAMVGGAGVMAGRASARRSQQEAEQEERLASLEAQQAPASPSSPPGSVQQPAAVQQPAPGQQDDLVAKLSQLKEMADAGALTPAEFDAAKQKLLASGP